MKLNSLLKFFARDEPLPPIVSGHLRVWQWVVLWLVVAAVLLLLPRTLLRIVSPIVAADFCTVGAFGILIGWWKTILVLAFPVPVLIGVGFYAITFSNKIKNLRLHPATGKKPLVDTPLRQGEAVRRYATQNLVSGVAAILMATMAIYFFADMTAQFGFADVSNIAQACGQ
jgi:hypothetical protein